MGKKTTKKRGRPKEWTEQRATALGEKLLAWLRADETRMFVSEFAVAEGMVKSRLSNLAKEFDGFCELYARAKEIQEVRLLNGAITGKLDAGLTKFLLVNHHGYVGEHSKVESTNRNMNADVEPTEEEWNEFWARECFHNR